MPEETKMEVPIQPVTPPAPKQVDKAEILGIRIQPARDVINIRAKAGDKQLNLRIEGEKYAQVIAQIDLPKLTAMLMPELQQAVQDAIAG